jgi:hypothetical protein
VVRRAPRPGLRHLHLFRQRRNRGKASPFNDEDGRTAHLNGQIPAALGEVGPDLLAKDSDIQLIDILAVK